MTLYRLAMTSISAMISLTVMSLPGVNLVLAQMPALPEADRNGDYFSNDAPIHGTAHRPLVPGSLWRVVSPELNCRSQVGRSDRVVRQFKAGDLLQADVGRGGSDEVLVNAKDKNGKPWMRVRSSAGSNYNCYVRANDLYIQPYPRQEDNSPQ